MSMKPHWKRFLMRRSRCRHTLTILGALLVSVLLGTWIGPLQLLQAAFIEGEGGPDVLIGRDDDNVDNPIIQPEGAVNQSLNNTDILEGKAGNDILIGLLGNDVLHGGPGGDILIGGPEGAGPPNSDIIFGDEGNDVNIWQAGDGSDAFIGGQGRDAMVFGTMDRDTNNVPILSAPVPGYPHGVPTANVSGQGGFCTLEPVDDPSLGYEFLVRFFVRATGNLAVTIRLAEVEQVFCTSQAGGQITFADLTQADPQFVVVTLEEVEKLNQTVAQIIR
jgi:RTX calcium-binding nonapeptide repeat (4 copies)